MTDNLHTWLEERETIHGKATEGPWEWEPESATEDSYRPARVYAEGWTGYPVNDACEIVVPQTNEDATAIVDAHNTLPKLLRGVRAVLELHVPETEYGPDYYSGKYPCIECNRADQEGLHPTPWPCPTLEALQEAINDA